MIGLLRSEWTKLSSLRSTPGTVVLALALAIGLGMLVANRFGARHVEAPAGEFDPVFTSLFGLFSLAPLAIGALGVLTVTSEYASGMIRTTLCAVPWRGRLLAAKATVAGGFALLVGLVMAIGTFAASQPQLTIVGAPRAEFGDPGVFRAVIGAGLWLAGVALLGVALGLLLRATAGAFAVLVAVLLVAPLLADALPPWFGKWWPTIAGQQIVSTVPQPDTLGPWAGLALMYATIAALLALSYAVFRRRDA
ncbi:ABC transporter permease [Catenuloplanes atrovinosus]|uniref:ABC-type transport system involved in multi-copper enzyme maturation permease subunit n=1 Tax=Catenuloplanes atrovinosus TaxID=137266 RepID=A0AAE4C8U5_9ACTN|nr:ABC transporter permease [Catenuloplanes atrovinosus]MDR7274977.1 ABC-type transport system involved in multi-copper enzyme maturation permease subunit [Catenuloplanes atrovinosus]